MNTSLDTTSKDAPGRWLLFGAYFLWVAFAVILTDKTLRDPKNHSTYLCFETGARRWLDGRNTYDSNDGQDFRYGPAFAWAMGPIAVLPMGLGAVVWALLNLGISFWAIQAIARRILPDLATNRRMAAYLVLALIGSSHSLWALQPNITIFGLVAFAAIAILDKRWWLASLLLAVPVHIKVWPLAGAMLLAACWPKKLALRLPAAIVAVGALPFLFKPFGWVCEQYVNWYHLLVGPAQKRHTYFDAWTIWESFVSPVEPHLYTILQLAMAVAGLGLCLWQSSRKLSDGRLLLFVLVTWTTWQLVFGPGTERNTFGLIAPLTAWAMVESFFQRRGRWVMFAVFALILIASSGGLERQLSIFASLIKSAHPIAMIVFYGWYSNWNRSPVSGEYAFPYTQACPAVDF